MLVSRSREYKFSYNFIFYERSQIVKREKRISENNNLLIALTNLESSKFLVISKIIKSDRLINFSFRDFLAYQDLNRRL